MALVPREFFARPSTEVAPELLGMVLEHRTAAGLVAVRLTEVEAYAGDSDPASHAYRGRTARNAVMFGPPGHAYVYFTYGMHFCVNLVCLGGGSASAVLLRAGAIVAGEELARARRTAGPGADRVSSRGKPVIASRDLARGPARLCQALDIDRSLDGADVCVPGSPLRVRWPDASSTPSSGQTRAVVAGAPLGSSCEAQPPATSLPRPAKVVSGPRVGVSAAAEVPWRFWIEGDPTVSPYRAHVPRGKPVTSC